MGRTEHTGARASLPPDHPDRLRWNMRYREQRPDFAPHPLAAEALAAGMPTGAVLELAGGRSGSALTLAAAGRSVIVVDASDVALSQLAQEADRRGLSDRIECVVADATTYDLDRARFALVLATRFWDVDAFRFGCAAVAPGGLLGWEALAAEEPRRWHVTHGSLGSGLPNGFEVLAEQLLTQGERRWTRLLARRNLHRAG